MLAQLEPRDLDATSWLAPTIALDTDFVLTPNAETAPGLLNATASLDTLARTVQSLTAQTTATGMVSAPDHLDASVKVDGEDHDVKINCVLVTAMDMVFATMEYVLVKLGTMDSIAIRLTAQMLARTTAFAMRKTEFVRANQSTLDQIAAPLHAQAFAVEMEFVTFEQTLALVCQDGLDLTA